MCLEVDSASESEYQ